MMKRKLFNQSLRTALLAAMCLISLSFVSCGGDDDDEGSEESANYVDLGLSVYWAKCNVGASEKSDYGYYFAWAETETKDDYNYDSSVSFMENISDFSGSYLYDAARVNLGGKWRTPTLEEFEELIENCTWYWSKNKGVSGYLVKGKMETPFSYLQQVLCRKVTLIIGGKYLLLDINTLYKHGIFC